MERKIREKERDYDDIVSKLATLIIDENQANLGVEVAENAKEKVKNKNAKETKSVNKEENVNGKEKVRRAGRPRKSA